PGLFGAVRAGQEPVRLPVAAGARAPAGLAAAAALVEEGLRRTAPMRELILLRHAHALPAVPGQADLDRALSPEGLAEAEAAGRWAPPPPGPAGASRTPPAARRSRGWPRAAARRGPARHGRPGAGGGRGGPGARRAGAGRWGMRSLRRAASARYGAICLLR